MKFYKLTENYTTSVVATTITPPNDAYTEISEMEYNSILEEIVTKAEAERAAYEAEHADDVPDEQVASELAEVLS